VASLPQIQVDVARDASAFAAALALSELHSYVVGVSELADPLDFKHFYVCFHLKRLHSYQYALSCMVLDECRSISELTSDGYVIVTHHNLIAQSYTEFTAPAKYLRRLSSRYSIHNGNCTHGDAF
jgi:hypothetical protein